VDQSSNKQTTINHHPGINTVCFLYSPDFFFFFLESSDIHFKLGESNEA